MSSFKVDLESLKFLMRKISDPQVQQRISNLAHEKGAIAIIAQAIADNFNLEGPGWPPLKMQTIRRSVKGKVKKAVADMTDKELERHEKWSRKPGADKVKPFRRILQLTGLLKKTVTVPGFTGSSTAGKGKPAQTGSNIYKVEGTNIIWGTNLVYASAHNDGAPKKKIPQRKFLVIRPEWQEKLEDWSATQVLIYLREAWAEIIAS